MTERVVREEIDKLAELLHVPAERVQHLAHLGYDNLLALRQRVTTSLADKYDEEHRRLRLYRRSVPLRVAVPLAAKILPPRLIGRAAASALDDSEMERALRVLSGMDPGLVADAAPYIDPRVIARFAHLAPPALVHGLMMELLRRNDFSTADLFADYLDESALGAGRAVNEPLITNVSDTARWVAAYRAIESARPDALFVDPLAARLAGERGRAIAEGPVAPRGGRSGWPQVVRTKLIDDLIVDSLAHGCDRVVNLAAGLDTRPYRMDLPAELLWHEADLPALLAEKDELLADEKPCCGLVRTPVDVTDTVALTAFLDAATEGAHRTLVITEGLLPYLTPTQVSALCGALRRPEIRWWLLDLYSPMMRQAVNLSMGRHLGSARWHFAPADGVRFFTGWTAVDTQSLFEAAARWNRSPKPLRLHAHLPGLGTPTKPGQLSLWSGAVRLQQDRFEG
ncbi:SAM-dependent methyltransferase [Nocardia sp. NPDC005366]|uniref:class I SAM-dependent methyltransferase n=1 Tax=Nocardia sp. NPDC005366 TaxID=3156878 RepID=UPI0033BE9DA8